MADRLDTKLESEGAEFLVLGLMLIERIATYKTYTQMPGYDLVATNPETRRSARIQVKSRWATDSNQTVLLRSWEFDFLVYVGLNRGNRYRRTSESDRLVREPDVYVFPKDIARLGIDQTSSWGRIATRKIPDRESWRSRWDCIRDFVAMTPGIEASA
jgi:hypothetical protein